MVLVTAAATGKPWGKGIAGVSVLPGSFFCCSSGCRAVTAGNSISYGKANSSFVYHDVLSVAVDRCIDYEDERPEIVVFLPSMEHKAIEPCITLTPYIHSFWELKGGVDDNQWDRIFPDGCPGLIVNLGDKCVTDNGAVSMEPGKSYVVGAMTSFKESFITAHTHLVGVCLKPGVFSNFYQYAPLNELTDQTVQLEKAHAFNVDKCIQNPFYYLNSFLQDRSQKQNLPLQPIIDAIHQSNGQLSIKEIARETSSPCGNWSGILTHILVSLQKNTRILFVFNMPCLK
ncbi:hypothetical protein MKQ70_36015 [Chitinophaga sedimenti]|uniref:DUF6597 domain-containing transcriptional factor n=1 Tax=Chitinophaga sedimenti TaxID=2033606 RepID=UPI002004064C|nr:DUF6597 domain-containing transcriptional factor [Chitinophaga sedimenti]MCK7560041.1 hypothetical protein [Chitinophaga sedimenti]